MTVASGGTLDLNGFNHTLPSVTNAGLVNMGTGTGRARSLTTTNYSGAGGTIALNTFLGADGSPSDRLVINGGTATGNSFLRITPAAGSPGAETVANGILVVHAFNATTAATAFTLAGEVRAGFFDYRLFRGAPAGSDRAVVVGVADDWFLRSTFVTPSSPEPGPQATEAVDTARADRAGAADRSATGTAAAGRLSRSSGRRSRPTAWSSRSPGNWG